MSLAHSGSAAADWRGAAAAAAISGAYRTAEPH